ncbi:MAG: hypothetical protein R2717_02990 [Schumannella sp.]
MRFRARAASRRPARGRRADRAPGGGTGIRVRVRGAAPRPGVDVIVDKEHAILSWDGTQERIGSCWTC